jgi:hypothetical protein
MATMPSRAETAPRAIASILGQVSRLWLFLDRFESIPDYADDPRVLVLRTQAEGDLRGNGKLLGLALEDEPCTYFAVDDDIEYPVDHCRTLERHLDRYGGRAVVGVHAAHLVHPLTSYRDGLHVLHRRASLARAEDVDVLGADSLALRTSTLRFDVRRWPDVNMIDLSFALEARRRGVPLVAVPRRANWVRALDENQPDSIWIGVLTDDSRQTVLAQELLALPRPPSPRRRRAPALRLRSA